MGFQREFDPAIGDESLRACVNDGALVDAESHALAVNATTSSSLSLPAGIYRVFLQGMSAAETIAMVTGGSGVTAALPTADAWWPRPQSHWARCDACRRSSSTTSKAERSSP
jgi:hypothetical protein